MSLLDAKDRQLLFALDMDARQPISALARTLRLSKPGVEYKVRRLEEKGVIRGYYPIINVPKLGYLYCRIALSLQNMTAEDERRIIAELVADKRFFWVFSVQGPYDLLLVTWARSLAEFEATLRDIACTYGRFIKEKNASLPTDVIHYQHRYLLGNVATREIHVRETSERVTIDETDRCVLKELAEDARRPLVKIGERLNLHPKVVAYRIARMERVGLIEGYRPILDHEALGRTYFKVWCRLQNLTPERYTAIKEWVRAQPITIYHVEGVGLPADLDFEVMVESAQELYCLMRDLKHAFPETIGEYQTMIFIRTEKVKYWPF